MKDTIWTYISNRYENDGVLVDADEVYTAYAIEFDNGYPVEVIDEVMRDFASCSDLTGIEIEYEGELYGICTGRTAQEPTLPQKTA